MHLRHIFSSFAHEESLNLSDAPAAAILDLEEGPWLKHLIFFSLLRVVKYFFLNNCFINVIHDETFIRNKKRTRLAVEADVKSWMFFYL